jgi:hypothetical protein
VIFSILSEKFSRFKINKNSYISPIIVSQTASLRRPDRVIGLL